MSDTEREARADYTITNTDLDTVQKQVEELHAKFSNEVE
jgi:hypothetical protein